MTQQLKKSRNNPQVSATHEKQQLKRVDQQLHTMKNRVELLRQQLQKEKDSVKKNKTLVKEVIQKKIQVNRINQLKQKDNSEEDRRVEELRNRNRYVRETHGRDLDNIQKAIYLVKLDDARQVKNISMEHRRKLKDMDRDFLSAQKQKKKKVSDESQQAKQRFQKYWRDKLQSIYTEQAESMVKALNEKENKKKNIKSLQEEEISLLEEINKVHSKQVESKKEYLAALSLPVKDVAQAMGDSIDRNPMKRSMANSSMGISKSRYDDQQDHQKRSIDNSGIKMPNANVNQAKLKIILSQLKKMDKQELNYSARN